MKLIQILILSTSLISFSTNTAFESFLPYAEICRALSLGSASFALGFGLGTQATNNLETATKAYLTATGVCTMAGIAVDKTWGSNAPRHILRHGNTYLACACAHAGFLTGAVAASVLTS